MTGKRKSKRDMAMSQAIKLIQNAHPGISHTQVLSMVAKQLSAKKIKQAVYSLCCLWELDHYQG